jgi:hypothetical protein
MKPRSVRISWSSGTQALRNEWKSGDHLAWSLSTGGGATGMVMSTCIGFWLWYGGTVSASSIDGDAERPDVDLGVVARVVDNDLGRDEDGRADERVLLGHGVLHLARDAKVGQLRLAGRVDENVVALDVAVNFLVEVQIEQAEQHVATNHRNLLLVEAALADVQHVSETAERAKLHENVHVPTFFCLVNVVSIVAHHD